MLNEYYLVQQRADEPIRRWVIYHRDIDKDPQKVPFLWAQWLRYVRDYPPTPRELNIYQQALDRQSIRNERWSVKEQKLRDDEVASGMHQENQEEPSFFDLMKEYAEDEKRKTGEKESEVQSKLAEPPKAEPTGEFYDFKPGVWRAERKREELADPSEKIRETWKPIRMADGTESPDELAYSDDEEKDPDVEEIQTWKAGARIRKKSLGLSKPAETSDDDDDEEGESESEDASDRETETWKPSILRRGVRDSETKTESRPVDPNEVVDGSAQREQDASSLDDFKTQL